LTRLVMKSLVVANDRDGETRYRLQEPIRQYAQTLLEDRGERAEARACHATYFLERAEQVVARVWGGHFIGPIGRPEQLGQFARLEREHDNLRAALAWAEQEANAETLARLLASLGAFWVLQRHFAEGSRWPEAALSGSAGLPATLRARVGALSGLLRWLARGDYAGAAQLLEESLALFRALGDDWHVAIVLNLW